MEDRCVRCLRHVLIYQEKKMPLILFGGMKMQMRSVLRYATLYPKTMQAHVVPLDLKHLVNRLPMSIIDKGSVIQGKIFFSINFYKQYGVVLCFYISRR